METKNNKNTNAVSNILSFTSCSIIEGIFKAGIGVGIFIFCSDSHYNLYY
jgi:hypothetical protein